MARIDLKAVLFAFLGGGVGAGLGTVGGYLIGLAYVETYMPYAGMEALGPILLGAAIGFLTGACLGAWALMRIGRVSRAGPTALLSAVFAAGATVGALWVTPELDGLVPERAGPLVFWLLLLIGGFLSALVARAIVMTLGPRPASPDPSAT